MKKQKGMVEDILPLFISILATVAVVVSFLNVINMVTLDADFNRIGRKYMLEMESVGYLTAAAKTELQQILQEKGAIDIDFAGTTMSEPGYGNPIYLEIVIKVPLEALNIDNGLLKAVTEEKVWTYTISQMSTAKY